MTSPTCCRSCQFCLETDYIGSRSIEHWSITSRRNGPLSVKSVSRQNWRDRQQVGDFMRLADNWQMANGPFFLKVTGIDQCSLLLLPIELLVDTSTKFIEVSNNLLERCTDGPTSHFF
jgi:hypothetical protein